MSHADDMIESSGFGRARTKMVGPAYKCSVCGKRFGNRTLLKIHKNHDHSDTHNTGEEAP